MLARPLVVPSMQLAMPLVDIRQISPSAVLPASGRALFLRTHALLPHTCYCATRFALATFSCTATPLSYLFGTPRQFFISLFLTRSVFLSSAAVCAVSGRPHARFWLAFVRYRFASPTVVRCYSLGFMLPQRSNRTLASVLGRRHNSGHPSLS